MENLNSFGVRIQIFFFQIALARNLGVMKEATTVKDVESSDPGCPAECSIPT